MISKNPTSSQDKYAQPAPHENFPEKENEPEEPLGHVIDPNTTLDVFVSPKGFVTELSDTVDEMDGAAVEVIDLVNEADRTRIELTLIEEATDHPEINSIDRFIEVEGIGPEIAQLLNQAGIRSFSELAETPVDRLREILSTAGSQYRIHDATTWPGQARQLAIRNASRKEAPSAKQSMGHA